MGYASLNDRQKHFCKCIALYEMTPFEAYIAAGYTVSKRKIDTQSHVFQLLSSKIISDEIDRLRNHYLDLDSVRRDIILEHQRTREMDICDVCKPVSYIDDFGNTQTRLEVLPVSEWSPELRKACTGFDKYGVPQFKQKESATKELSRMFGLYKDNAVVVQQPLDEIYNDALGEKTERKDFDVVLDTDYSEDELAKLEELDKKFSGNVVQEYPTTPYEEELEVDVDEDEIDINFEPEEEDVVETQPTLQDILGD